MTRPTAPSRLLPLAGLALLAGALGLIWWGLREAPRGTGPVLAAERPVEDRPQAVAFDGEAPSESKAAAPRAALLADQPIAIVSAMGAPAPKPDAPITRVIVRVGDPGDEKSPFAGLEVEVQTWISATAETFHHRATLDDRGVAVLKYLGAIHVDWAKFEPPGPSGLGLAIFEGHDNVGPGDSYKVELDPKPAGSIHGRVVDLEGRGIGGARVHAYRRGWMSDDLDPPWTPGVAQVLSLADGSFRFDQLAADESWGIALEPVDWLQVWPDIEDTDDNVVRQVLAGQVADPVLIKAERAHNFAVTLRDPTGAPVADARVELSPVQFANPRVIGGAQGKPENAKEMIHDGLAVGWPYGNLHGTTNAAGRAELPAIAGTWQIKVSLNRRPLLETTYLAPGSDLVLELPYVPRSWSGQIVGLDGEPVARPNVQLSWEDAGNRGNSGARGDRQGRFTFEQLPPASVYTLRAENSGYVRAEWLVTSLDLPGQQYSMRRSGRLTLSLSDQNGNPVPNLRIRILDGVADSGLRPEERGWREFAMGRSGNTDNGGGWTVNGLAPGTYEAALMVMVDPPPPAELESSKRAQRGVPRAVEQEWARWSLHTDEHHLLTVDLSGYVAPAIVEKRNGLRPLIAAPAGRQSGVVRGPDGAPLERAVVLIMGNGLKSATLTDSDGAFLLQVAPGTYTLQVHANGMTTVDMPGIVVGSGHNSYEIELEKSLDP
ncbi:MAG TPA: carboxypeptidase-like regulatory domain-containing protein [Planctomycetota bacterium]